MRRRSGLAWLGESPGARRPPVGGPPLCITRASLRYDAAAASGGSNPGSVALVTAATIRGLLEGTPKERS